MRMIVDWSQLLKPFLKTDFIQRSSQYDEIDRLLTLATLLDPRAKSLLIFDEDEMRSSNH